MGYVLSHNRAGLIRITNFLCLSSPYNGHRFILNNQEPLPQINKDKIVLYVVCIRRSCMCKRYGHFESINPILPREIALKMKQKIAKKLSVVNVK